MKERESIKWARKRIHPRIAWSFMVRFRPHSEVPVRGGWYIAVIKNISVGGCYFYSSVPYESGQILDLEVQLPRLVDTMKFLGEVKRCERNEEEKVNIYGVAVQFTDMDQAKKEIFIKTITFFLKKQAYKPTKG